MGTDYIKFEREYDSNKLSESDNESDDSPIQETRIRRAAEFDDAEVAHEGNRTTFLRPSRTNKCVEEMN
jgi:hypothetical protein